MSAVARARSLSWNSGFGQPAVVSHPWGGYPSLEEIDWFKKYRDGALQEPRLAEEHRQFISELKLDEQGLPRWRGNSAGVGGVYTIRKVS